VIIIGAYRAYLGWERELPIGYTLLIVALNIIIGNILTPLRRKRSGKGGASGCSAGIDGCSSSGCGASGCGGCGGGD